MTEQHLNGMQISREQWSKMTPENRDLVLYNALAKMICQPGICNKTFKKIYGYLIVIALLLVIHLGESIPDWAKTAMALIP